MASSPRPTKRPRLEEDTTNKSKPDAASPLSGEESQLPALTLEIWADCMEYLLFKEILGCCAVSKPFLSDVMPKVRLVCIDSPQEMKIQFAHRFPGVEAVEIFLLESTVYTDGSANKEFIDEVIFGVGPFVSGFPRLEELILQCKEIVHEEDATNVYYYSAFDDLYFAPVSRYGPALATPFGNLVKSLCSCYSTGVISQKVDIPEILDFHVCLQRGRNASDRECSQCRQVCKSFPVIDVAGALVGCQSRVRPKNYAEYQRSICLPAKDVIKYLMKRNGGEAVVRNPFVLFVALINERYDIVNALIKLDLLPEVTRNDIETRMRKSWKDGVRLKGADAKPECINASVFRLLVRKEIPLRKTDFKSIKEGPLPELREGDNDEWVDLDED